MSYQNHDYNGNVLVINNVSDQGINYYRNDVNYFANQIVQFQQRKNLLSLTILIRSMSNVNMCFEVILTLIDIVSDSSSPLPIYTKL